jgi:hypothetical protein
LPAATAHGAGQKQLVTKLKEKTNEYGAIKRQMETGERVGKRALGEIDGR